MLDITSYVHEGCYLIPHVANNSIIQVLYNNSKEKSAYLIMLLCHAHISFS